MNLEARIAAYLDGELDEQAAAEIEAAFVDPEVAAMLSEELLVRELLAALPPDEPPEALIKQIEESLGVSTGVLAQARARLKNVAPTREWGLRGIVFGARALAAAPAGVANLRAAASGVSSVGQSIGMVAEITRAPERGQKPKPLWQRAATALWRRRK